MLNKFSSLGTVLNKEEQKSINGSGGFCIPHRCPIGEEWSREECTCVPEEYISC